MILPNKLVKFQDSIIAKAPVILEEISSEKNLSILELFGKVNQYFEDVNQYILVLDVLFALEKIYFDEKAQVIIYVEANKL